MTETPCNIQRCKACKLFLACGSCNKDLCMLKHCDGFCGKCNFVCHRHSLLPTFESIIGNPLELPVLDPIEPMKLSISYLPTFKTRPVLELLKEKVTTGSFGMDEIFSHLTRRLLCTDLHKRCRMENNVNIILHFYIKDPVLEGFWQSYLAKEIMFDLQKLNIFRIITPNFSNYFDTPKYGHFINFKRTLLVGKTLQELGKKIILDISAPSDSMCAHICNYLTRNPQIKCIAFNCQTAKSYKRMVFVHRRLSMFDQACDKDVEFIIQGAERPETKRILEGMYKPRKIYFMNSIAYFLASCHRTINRDFVEDDIGELMIRNLESLEKSYGKITKEDYQNKLQRLSKSPS